MKAGYTVYTSDFREGTGCVEVINYLDNNEVVHIFWSNYFTLKVLSNKYSIGVWKINK